MDIHKVGDHECIQCGECIKVCPSKAISWKGSQFFLKQNAVADTTSPVPTEKVDLVAMANNANAVNDPNEEQTVESEVINND